MSGNESPGGGGEDSLSLSLSTTSSSSTLKSMASSTRDVTSIHQLDPKYKNYVAAVDKALKSFEYSSEWHDLISALSKLNKVITTWSGKYGGDLPRIHLVTKRLSQCLHPNLPGGVHLKTLETYELIFKSIPADRTESVIGPDLFSFAAGLFPLWTYASEQSRPTLLRIYESYLIPFIKHPALEGFLISILSGLSEDDSSAASTPTVVKEDPLSTIGRVNNLLGTITANVGTQNFNKVLWQVLKSNSKIRLAGINYILRKSALTEDESLAVETLCCCLTTHESTNESVLVQRATLDLLLNHFQLHTLNHSSDCEEKKTMLIKASLKTLLRRDLSLNRRFFGWLLGTEPGYFEANTKPFLINGCIRMLNDNVLSSSEIVRVLISLLDKSEVSILDDILLHIVSYFKRIDSKKCAHLFFVNLKPDYVLEQVVGAVVEDVEGNCGLLEYLIELDLSCFEYEKLLPHVFQTLLEKSANSQNIGKLECVLKLILKKIELTDETFEAFVQFYLAFVNYDGEEELGERKRVFDFEEFRRPKMTIEEFWMSRADCEKDIYEKFAVFVPNSYQNLSVSNSIFEEFLDPRILKEISTVTKWMKALIVIGCRGDVDTISLLVKVLKLLEKSLRFQVVEETYLIELATRILWMGGQFETLSELVCLHKVKVERILLTFLKDFESFGKLIQFLDFVGDFNDVKLLVYKVVENLDSSFEQYPHEFLELREQAEEFCSKMLRENDLRFLDVFISNLLSVELESVGEHLSKARRREKESQLRSIGDEDPTNKTEEAVSCSRRSEGTDSTSECSYHSEDDEEELEEEEDASGIKSNSTPDLTKLNNSCHSGREEFRKTHRRQASRSMGDLTKILVDLEVHQVPEVLVQDPEGSGDDQRDFVKKESPRDQGYNILLTPSTELDVEAKAKPTPSNSKGFSKKLSHPHLKVAKGVSEDVQYQILYVLSKLKKLLTLRPDLFVTYLKTCNTNQSAQINIREECIYLELLIGKLLDFMCIVLPDSTGEEGEESGEGERRTLQLGNLNIQFKSADVLKLLLEKLIETERMEMPSASSSGSGCSRGASAGSNNKSGSGTLSTPTSSTTVLSRRQNFSKLKRKSSVTGTSSSHFIADLLTRVKLQKTLLFVLRSTTNFSEMAGGESSSLETGADISCDLILKNYSGHHFLTIYQGHLVSLSRTVICLEYLLNSTHGYYHPNHTSKSFTSFHRSHPPNPKYLASLPLTNQPLFHEILLTALELRTDRESLSPKANSSSHFKWMDLNLHILPLICNSSCPLTILTVTQVCKNLQQSQREEETYILRSLDYLISVANAVLFRHGERKEKPDEVNQNQVSSSIYGIITSFLPVGSSASPKIESVDEIDSQSKDLLSKLDVILNTALKLQAESAGKPSSLLVINKIRNLLNPVCNSFLEHFLTSLSLLQPRQELTTLCKEIQTIRIEKLTILTTRVLNRNLILFYRDYMRQVETVDFNPSLLNSLAKECLSKSCGLVTICEIISDLYPKFKSESWSKQELKEVQESLFKIFDRMVADVCNQNSYLLMDSNSMESNSSGGGLDQRTSKSYNVKKVSVAEESLEDILASFCISLPNLMDLLWTDDKDRDKIMPMLTHLLANLIGLIKIRHTSTPAYVSILKLLKNMSYYSYYRKAWKKEIFDMLLLEPHFFQMIKPHYYYTPYVCEDSHQPSRNSVAGKVPENQCVVSIWKVIMDNLFTQDKSSFSELLTRVSVPQTTSLNIFTSKDTEFEGRALLLRRLAFVIWSSEQDQFSKFISNIQERLAEALKTPNSPQIVPIILRSVFLCFRVLILKFSNLSALWPIVIHEVVQVLLQMEKQLLNGSKLDGDQLSCALEVFKLIELLSSMPAGSLPLFQMYRWAFLPNPSISNEEVNLIENNNLNTGFLPFLARISFLLREDSSGAHRARSLAAPTNPSRIRILNSLNDVSEFLNGNCDNMSTDELCQELDLDFIEC